MDNIVIRATRLICLFIALCMLLWIVIPEGRSLVAGLALGSTASVINIQLLRNKVLWISRIAAGEVSKRTSLGMVSRLSIVLLVVMTAYRYPDLFSLVSTLAACFIAQLAAYIIALVDHKKISDGKG
jgi:ATP synthase protein I